MYQNIYIDMVFLTNLLMDYMILRLAGKLLHLTGSRVRSLLAAMLGAGISCLILCIPFKFPFPAAVLLHGTCAFFMASFAYRLKGSINAEVILIMYLTAFVIGGICQALAGKMSVTAPRFLLLMAGIYTAASAVICGTEAYRLRRKNIYPVTLLYQKKKHETYGFFDTGNLLMDPVNRRPVSIVTPELLEKILSGETVKKLRYIKEEPEKLGSMELTGLKPHFLSCHTADGKEGLFLGIVLDELWIHTPGRVVQVGKPVLAITFEPSALGEEYGILLNSRLLN